MNFFFKLYNTKEGTKPGKFFIQTEANSILFTIFFLSDGAIFLIPYSNFSANGVVHPLTLFAHLFPIFFLPCFVLFFSIFTTDTRPPLITYLYLQQSGVGFVDRNWVDPLWLSRRTESHLQRSIRSAVADSRV